MVKFLSVLALASVLKRKIFSHFPDYADEMQTILRNQVICPRAECLSEVRLHVLFCKLGGQRLHEKRKRVLPHLQTKTKKKLK